LIVTPLENWFGVVDIYVSATDGYFYAYDTVAVSVQNVNDSPVISTLPDTTTLEDVTLILPVTIYDVDGDDLEISAQVDSNIVTVVVDEQSLLIQPTPDSSGTTAIALIVSDGLLQDTTSFLLTIVPLNDAPVTAEIPDLNMFEDDTLYYIVEVTDIEGDSITLSAEPAIGDVVVNISATELEIIPAANWFGDTEINITASDGSMESSISAALHVENVNDAPQPFALEIVDSVFIDMDNINTDSLTLTWAVAGDTDGDPITYFFTAELRALESAGGAVLFNMAELIDEQELVNGELEWDVIATDGIDSTWSANGPAVVLVDIQGTLGIEDDLLPLTFALYQNYPNPFNPTTIITYDLPEATRVELVIYDIMGQRVATIKNGRQDAGLYHVRWNGTNDLGTPVSTGLYFYQLNSTPFSATRKMVFMK